jgi:ATP-dependent Lon protease
VSDTLIVDLQVAVVGDVGLDGIFLPMGGFLELDMRLAAETTVIRTVIVPKADEYACQKLQADLVADGLLSVKKLQFVGAKTIWDAVEVAFSSAKAVAGGDASSGAVR